ncbi:MAG: DMT family transporter, partial [Pseudomonadota bacterium]
NQTMTASQWLLLVGLSVVWGGSFFFVEVVVDDLPPLTIVFFRVLLAAIALHLFLLATGKAFRWRGKAWRVFLFMGLANNAIPFSLLVFGQTELASGVAAILNATTPMFTVAISHFASDDDRLTSLRVAGIFAAVVGVVVMIGAAGIQGSSQVALLAYAACIGAPISYSIAVVFGRQLLKKIPIDPIMVAAGQLTAASIFVLPMMLWVDQPWTLAAPTVSIVAAMTGLAVLSTALAYIGYFKLLASAGATNLSLVTILVPVSAILLGVTILGEELMSRHIVGFALIALGLALVDGRLFKRQRKVPAS